jgi:hypothetical protein
MFVVARSSISPLGKGKELCHKMHEHDINPASGLPMMNDVLDVGGNPWGTTSWSI